MITRPVLIFKIVILPLLAVKKLKRVSILPALAPLSS